MVMLIVRVPCGVNIMITTMKDACMVAQPLGWRRVERRLRQELQNQGASHCMQSMQACKNCSCLIIMDIVACSSHIIWRLFDQASSATVCCNCLNMAAAAGHAAWIELAARRIVADPPTLVLMQLQTDFALPLVQMRPSRGQKLKINKEVVKDNR